MKLLIPVKSNAVRSTNPKLAQNNDCDVSNKLRTMKHFRDYELFRIKNIVILCTWRIVSIWCKLYQLLQNLEFGHRYDNIWLPLIPQNTIIVDLNLRRKFLLKKLTPCFKLKLTYFYRIQRQIAPKCK